MNELVAFLRARLNEDERYARAFPGIYEDAGMSDEAADWGGLSGFRREKRLLRDVAAKRMIVDLFEQTRAEYQSLADERGRSLAAEFPKPSDKENRAMDMGDAYGRAMYLLALPYKDHPDYLPEWQR